MLDTRPDALLVRAPRHRVHPAELLTDLTRWGNQCRISVRVNNVNLVNQTFFTFPSGFRPVSSYHGVLGVKEFTVPWGIALSTTGLTDATARLDTLLGPVGAPPGTTTIRGMRGHSQTTLDSRVDSRVKPRKLKNMM